MRINSVQIKNFRGLKDISFDLPNRVTVIVGPNAIGKSSVLEAIRLTKVILAPSFYGEAQEVLKSLGGLIQSLEHPQAGHTLWGRAIAPGNFA